MKFAAVTFLLTITLLHHANLVVSADSSSCASSSSVASSSFPREDSSPPFVAAAVLDDGKVLPLLDTKECYADVESSRMWGATKVTTVYGCTGAAIGGMAQMDERQALSILRSANLAWKTGEWTQMSLANRIRAVQRFARDLLYERDNIVHVLMWEIGKTRSDAEAEFDRTVSFIHQTIEAIRSPSSEFQSSWQTIGSTRVYVRRTAIGIILCLGPFNYPLNETYATMIPALLMGNVILMKIPTVGGLVHLLTMKAFAKSFPVGTVNFVSGSGREILPVLMQTGVVNGLAFIGASAAANDLIQNHPHPHKLRLFLQLEANNMAIFLSDLFLPENKHVLQRALDETVAGALTFNGQRCTALKLVFVPTNHAKWVADEISNRVHALRIGLPWQTFDKDRYANITPLVNKKRVEFMKQLIEDATSKGATIVNIDGGSMLDSTLMVPAVLYPVTPAMKVYQEEQFGPIVPIAEYVDLDTVIQFGREGKYGQQVSIFTAGNEDDATALLIDQFSAVFGRININSQCSRSPDTVPFSARRSSGLGTMSVTEALREFSIPTVITYKKDTESEKQKQPLVNNDLIVEKIQKKSTFMAPL